MAGRIPPVMGTDFALRLSAADTGSGCQTGRCLPLMLTAASCQRKGQDQHTQQQKDFVFFDGHFYASREKLVLTSII